MNKYRSTKEHTHVPSKLAVLAPWCGSSRQLLALLTTALIGLEPSASARAPEDSSVALADSLPLEALTIRMIPVAFVPIHPWVKTDIAHKSLKHSERG